MAILVSPEEFRAWSGVGSQVPDATILATLDEAEAGLVADANVTVAAMQEVAAAAAIAHGEVLRRANRFIARRNSPESIAGAGLDGTITIPSRDPDSQRAVWAINSLLGTPEGIA